MNSIFHRRSIRQYTAKAVSRDDIEQVLRAAMAAPTACDDRQYQFYVVTNPGLRQQLAACSLYAGCAAGAPVVIGPCWEKETGHAPEYAPVNLSLVCENLMLEADDLGLGTVFLGIYPETDRMQKVSDALRLPANLVPFALIPLGHPAREAAKKDKFDPARIHCID